MEYASLHGNAATVCLFSKELGVAVKESMEDKVLDRDSAEARSRQNQSCDAEPALQEAR